MTGRAEGAARSRWTKTRETMFLEHLALTANVAAAERVAMMPAGSAYRERRRAVAFRRAWDRALREGYARLEMGMLERALETLGPEGAPAGDADGTVSRRAPLSERAAMTLLAAHRASVERLAAEEEAEGAREKVAALLTRIARHARRAGEGAQSVSVPGGGAAGAVDATAVDGGAGTTP